MDYRLRLGSSRLFVSMGFTIFNTSWAYTKAVDRQTNWRQGIDRERQKLMAGPVGVGTRLVRRATAV